MAQLRDPKALSEKRANIAGMIKSGNARPGSPLLADDDESPAPVPAAPKATPVVQGATAATGDAEASEEADDNLEKWTIRVHPDVKYSIEQYAKGERRNPAEMLRNIIGVGCKSMAIEIVKAPPKPSKKAKDEKAADSDLAQAQ